MLRTPHAFPTSKKVEEKTEESRRKSQKIEEKAEESRRKRTKRDIRVQSIADHGRPLPVNPMLSADQLHGKG